MKKPYLKDWYFIRMSDGHPYDKLTAIKAVFNEIEKKGVYNALNVAGGIGIVGKRKIDELDSEPIKVKILRLRKSHNGIIATTEQYEELLIAEDGMENMSEIIKKSRKLAEDAAKRAAKAEGAVLKARSEKRAAENPAPTSPSQPSITGVPQGFLGRVINI